MTLYRDRLGLGIFSIEPHMSHWILSVSGALGASGSLSVLPTSWDQPSESVYLSSFFTLDCLRDKRILRFRLRGLPPAGRFAAIGVGQRRCIQSLRSLSSFQNVGGAVFWLMDVMTFCLQINHEMRSSVLCVRVINHDVFCLATFCEIKDFLMPCVG